MKKKMKTNIDIYISTFGEKIYGKKQKNCIPIEVGAAVRDDEHECKYSLRDDCGVNMSKENPYYGELTAIYWMWKNTNSSYVGMYHYNKFLNISEDEAIRKFEEGYDFIVTKKGNFIDHAIPDEYSKFLKVMLDYDSKFYETFNKIANPKGSGFFSGQNMFITTRKHFDEYCSFLFPLLEEVRKSIGDSNESPYNKRYCAFFAERLLTPWLVYNGLKFYEVSLLQVGSWQYQIMLRIYRSKVMFLLPKKLKKMMKKKVRRSSYM